MVGMSKKDPLEVHFSKKRYVCGRHPGRELRVVCGSEIVSYMKWQ